MMAAAPTAATVMLVKLVVLATAAAGIGMFMVFVVLMAAATSACIMVFVMMLMGAAGSFVMMIVFPAAARTAFVLMFHGHSPVSFMTCITCSKPIAKIWPICLSSNE